MKRIYSLILVIIMLCSLCMSSAVGGSAEDPVVTKSYIDETYIPYILETAEQTINRKFDDILKNFSQSISNLSEPSGLCALLLSAAGYKLNFGISDNAYAVPDGIYIGGGLGTTFTPLETGLYAYLTNDGALVDVTEGVECYNGQQLIPEHTYMIASESASAVYAQIDTIVVIHGGYFTLGFDSISASSPNISVNPGNGNNTKYADTLKALGLFAGTDVGYELDRPATRTESIVMLLRLLGELPTAEDYPIQYKFKDVPDWASNYISYAYNMNYTAGLTETSFGSKQEVTAAQYLTFVLRALGYSDIDGDFYWETAGDFAVDIGLITASENRAFKTQFFRNEMVLVSYRALSTALKGSNVLLIDKLVALDVVSQVNADRLL